MLKIDDEILATTGASAIIRNEPVQTLWSGYGEIRRYALAGGKYPSIIVKHIPDRKQQNNTISHQRKLRSYQVEQKWYQQYAHHTNIHCRVPQSYHAVEVGTALLLIMEDLDASGYAIRQVPETVTLAHANGCLAWLAHFHANFMGAAPDGLWPVGTYWHLDTRQDEWKRMENIPLKHAAKEINDRLNSATYQTLVHGDAKLANFCFSDGLLTN